MIHIYLYIQWHVSLSKGFQSPSVMLPVKYILIIVIITTTIVTKWNSCRPTVEMFMVKRHAVTSTTDWRLNCSFFFKYQIWHILLKKLQHTTYEL